MKKLSTRNSPQTIPPQNYRFSVAKTFTYEAFENSSSFQWNGINFEKSTEIVFDESTLR